MENESNSEPSKTNRTKSKPRCIVSALLNSPYIFAWIEWNLAGMLHHKSRSAYGDIIHVRQILAELCSLARRHFSVLFVRHSVPSKFFFSTPPTSLHGFELNLAGILHNKSRSACVGAVVAEWLSSWLAEQEDRGSVPGLATWIFRDWLYPASKSRYGRKIGKSTLIVKTTNQPTNQEVHVGI